MCRKWKRSTRRPLLEAFLHTCSIMFPSTCLFADVEPDPMELLILIEKNQTLILQKVLVTDTSQPGPSSQYHPPPPIPVSTPGPFTFPLPLQRIPVSIPMSPRQWPLPQLPFKDDDNMSLWWELSSELEGSRVAVQPSPTGSSSLTHAPPPPRCLGPSQSTPYVCRYVVCIHENSF